MAMYITVKRGALTSTVEWHLGEPVPVLRARVVEFQADGDELVLFMDAMKAASNPHMAISYSKERSFFNG